MSTSQMLIPKPPMIGKAWTADYGDPHVPEDFDFIYPYSPLHNIPDHDLPPTLIMTADRE